MKSKERKIILSLKDSKRNILMTDKNPDDSVEELKNKLIKLMGSKKICTLQTQNDLLVFRPSQVSSIMVSSKEEFETENNDVAEETDFLDELEEEESSNYKESLTFDEDSSPDHD